MSLYEPVARYEYGLIIRHLLKSLLKENNIIQINNVIVILMLKTMTQARFKINVLRFNC
jgi:hypothetical protein